MAYVLGEFTLRSKSQRRRETGREVEPGPFHRAWHNPRLAN